MILLNCQEIEYSFMVSEGFNDLKSVQPIPTSLNTIVVFNTSDWACGKVDVAFPINNNWWDVTIEYEETIKNMNTMNAKEWNALGDRIIRTVSLNKFHYHTERTFKVESK